MQSGAPWWLGQNQSPIGAELELRGDPSGEGGAGVTRGHAGCEQDSGGEHRAEHHGGNLMRCLTIPHKLQAEARVHKPARAREGVYP